MNYHQRKYLSSSVLAITAFGALLLCNPSPGLAVAILAEQLASFAVLGHSGVTNVPTSTVFGNVGVSPGTSITAFNSVPLSAAADSQVTGGLVHATTDVAALAQGQLTDARTNLGLLAGSATQLTSPELAGLTLNPGVYSFSTLAGGFATLTGTSAVPGVLTLDGQNNTNAGWVFLIDSTLTTSAATASETPSSVVNVINTGSGAGIFWKVDSAATIKTYSTFQGNILALADIHLQTGATIGCGRALSDTTQVTMDMNTIGIGCAAGTGGVGSNGFSGGLTVPVGGGTPEFLPFASTGGGNGGGGVGAPEPTSLLLIGTGLVGLVFAVRRRKPSAGRHAVDELPA